MNKNFWVEEYINNNGYFIDSKYGAFDNELCKIVFMEPDDYADYLIENFNAIQCIDDNGYKDEIKFENISDAEKVIKWLKEYELIYVLSGGFSKYV